MMFTRLVVATILVIGFCGTGTAEIETTKFDNIKLEYLKRALAQYLMEESYDRYVPDLLENGATNEEAALKLIEFGTAATDCILDVAKLSAEERSIDFNFSYVEATLDHTDLRPLFRGEAEYRELVGPCFNTAREKSGIVSHR